MKVSSVQPTQTTFGTRYGKNLTKFLEENKDKLSTEQIVNISKIRNNGINSILELEKAGPNDKGCVYNLNLTGGVFDRKNYYMNWGGVMHRSFQEKIAGKVPETPTRIKSKFPIPIKDGEESVTKLFDEGNMLSEKISKEYNQATFIENAFKKFEDDWNKTRI